jgi:tryptophan synthase beta chain
LSPRPERFKRITNGSGRGDKDVATAARWFGLLEQGVASEELERQEGRG